MNTHDDFAYLARHTEQPAAMRHGDPGLTRLTEGLADLARRYDAFLVDQWGVLHDGQAPYPGAVQCLKRLAWAGKEVIIISNSGRRSICNEARLKKLGFPRNSFTHLVTSGEIAWQMLATGRGIFRKLIGSSCLMLSSDRPEEFAQGLPIELVENVEKAAFILLAGIDDNLSPDFYETMIKKGVSRKLPMVCINPDLTRITSNGFEPGAGAIAKAYQARGGRVRFIGKPYPDIYRYCLNLLPNVPMSRVIAVGDSIHHDIAGGHSAGLNTLLTLRGVHADHFRDAAPPDILHRIRSIAGPSAALPDWTTPSFRW